jgi:hypothetical protein
MATLLTAQHTSVEHRHTRTYVPEVELDLAIRGWITFIEVVGLVLRTNNFQFPRRVTLGILNKG